MCGAAAVELVVLGVDASPDAWKPHFDTIFSRPETLLIAPSTVIDAFDAAGLKCDRTFITDDLFDSYPFLGEPLKGDASLEKVVVAMAHILRMNRIAWLGQAAMCINTGIPAQFRGGYNLLTEEQKNHADQAALEVLNFWLATNGEQELDLESVQSKTQANLY